MQVRTPELDRRYEHIRALVVADQWVPGASQQELAQEWSLKRKTVTSYHADVLRQLRTQILGADLESLRTEIAIRADRTYRVAMDRKKPVVVPQGGDKFGSEPALVELYPDPDIKGAVNALRLYSSLAGLLVSQADVSDLRKKMDAMAERSAEEVENEILAMAKTILKTREVKKAKRAEAGKVH